MTNQQPSAALNPGDSTSGLSGAFRSILRKFLQDVDDMLPAIVISVTPDRQFVSVRAAIKVLGTDGSLTSRDPIAKVPVFTAGAGGFLMSFPIKQGDLGWIKANDRDISVFLQNNAEAGPPTNRFHTFENGLFIPDIVRTWALADEDSANAVWQSADGSIKITLGLDQIKIVHPTKVLIDTPQLICTGTITGQNDVLAGPDNISGKGHTHGGVATGSGHTGEPDA